jgi:hypothetical protein
LFFDDHLIAESALDKTWHLPKIHPGSPVVQPETPMKMNGGRAPVAAPFSDGVFYDPRDRLFKLWYVAGWLDGIAYATSHDGLRWTRPKLDVEPGTNRVLARRDGHARDGVAVWLDHEVADPAQRFKMFGYFRRKPPAADGGELHTSPDGIHWSEPRLTGPCGNNTCFYYDPFRKLWVVSVRLGGDKDKHGRRRARREQRDFLGDASWGAKDIIGNPWLAADDLDPPDPQLGYKTQLYNFTAVAYESVMLGLFMIHRGPPNDVCKPQGISKISDVSLGFSRDGVNWARPDRRAFIGCSRKPGTWNRAYIHPAGGGCLVVGGQLYFHFAAWSDISPKLGDHLEAGGSTGLAVLRRDGFLSLDSAARGGTLTTPPVQFSGQHLFVNAEAKGGELAVEAIRESGTALPGFGVEQCGPIGSDGTRQPVQWQNAAHLSSLAGKPARFRFHLTRAKLYSLLGEPGAFRSQPRLRGGRRSRPHWPARHHRGRPRWQPFRIAMEEL